MFQLAKTTIVESDEMLSREYIDAIVARPHSRQHLLLRKGPTIPAADSSSFPPFEDFKDHP